MSPPPNSPEHSSTSLDDARWFMEEVQPHETSLRSYLKGSFPTVRDVDDVVQESYVRLWRARAARPIKSARAFLFGIARRCAVDVIRRERRAADHQRLLDSRSPEGAEAGSDVAETISTRQEIALLAEALHSLPARCREVMVLRKIEHLPQQEIATRLGISVATVEVQIFRGMEKCARYLRRRGVNFSAARR